MKTLLSIIISFLFLQALYANEIVSGSTLKHYVKPGAPIDMEFHSKKVDVNETADVNITLHTTINSGTVSIETVLDPELESIKLIDQNSSFEVKPNEKTFIMNFKLKSKSEGIHYIKILTKVKTDYYTKLRAFAVPVYVGEYKKPVLKSVSGNSFKAVGSSENISVSQAKESIKILK